MFTAELGKLNNSVEFQSDVFYLKVPSHQIRSAWKWYGWICIHEYKNRRW